MSDIHFFHYKPGKTFMHILPSWIKIILMILLALSSFYIPLIPCFVLWIILILTAHFFLKFSIHEIIIDLKPCMVYFLMTYMASLILNITTFKTSKNTLNLSAILDISSPDSTYILLFMHLCLSIQITSIFYRTTSITQFYDGFSTIEKVITRKQKTPFSDILSLTLTFIPRISVFWNRIDSAWKARGGRDRITKVTVLTPVLFRVSMSEAYSKALARQNRTEYNFLTESEVYNICDAPHVENLMTK